MRGYINLWITGAQGKFTLSEGGWIFIKLVALPPNPRPREKALKASSGLKIPDVLVAFVLVLC